MSEIRILIGRHYNFGSEHNTSLTINNILPLLEKKFKVKIIWFFYLPEKMNLIKQKENEEILDIHDFKNGLEVIQKAKPDLIFDNEFPSIMDLSLDFAAKYFNIPVVTKFTTYETEKTTIRQFFTSFLPMFFQSSMPHETGEKKFMKRGRFFLYKYKFFLKTLFKIKLNVFEIFKYLLITIKWHVRYEYPYLNSKFKNSLYFLENESLKRKMIVNGFDEKSLIITGNPIFDKIFQKPKELKIQKSNNEKKKILLAPIQLYEGGIWTKKQRDFTIQSIVKKLSEHKDKFLLIVKIHPSSQSLKEYEEIVHEIDDSIEIIQNGIIEDYLDDIDTVLSFGTIYSSLIPVLITKKKLIICNFVNYNPITPIDTRVAKECTNIDNLIQQISDDDSFQNQKNNIDLYLNEIMYKTDGLASERMANALTELILTKQKYTDNN